MIEPKTQTLDLPGATVAYDVREAESESRKPVLLMIGSPLDASGFTTLAAHFLDRAVVTYVPGGVGRSPRADGATAATPHEHAEDLHRLISMRPRRRASEQRRRLAGRQRRQRARA